jgi:hypothetical protein
MKHREVDSSAYQRFGYKNEVLEVVHPNGAVYRYYGVPKSQMKAVLQAVKAKEAGTEGASVGRTLGGVVQWAKKNAKTRRLRDAKARPKEPEGTPPAELEATLKASVEAEKAKKAAPPVEVKPAPEPKPAPAPKKVKAAPKKKAPVVAKEVTPEQLKKATKWEVIQEGDGYGVYNARGKFQNSFASLDEAMKFAVRRSQYRKAVGKVGEAPTPAPPKTAKTSVAKKGAARPTAKFKVEPGEKYNITYKNSPTQIEVISSTASKVTGRLQNGMEVTVAKSRLAGRVAEAVPKKAVPPPPTAKARPKAAPAPKPEGKTAPKVEVRGYTGKGHKVGDVVKDSKGRRLVVEDVDAQGYINVAVPMPKKIVHGEITKGGRRVVDPEAEGVFFRTLGEEEAIVVNPAVETGKRPVYVTRARQKTNASREKRLLAGKDARGKPLPKESKPQTKTVKDSQGRTFGRVTFSQWLKRVDKELGLKSREYKEARHWYRNMRRLIRKEYPELSEKDVGILAFAATQKAASPTQGILNLNRVLDTLSGAKGRGKPGVSSKTLNELFEGADSITGFAEKLSDFADALYGRTTRSWTGRGGLFEPAPIDRHAYVDAGFITESVANFLAKQGVKVSKDIPRTTGTEAQYLQALKFYNELASWLNKNKVDGGGWTAHEAQAVGWTAIRKSMGLPVEDAAMAVSRNFRTVSAEVTGFAPKSDLASAVLKRGGLNLEESVQISNKIAPEVMRRAAQATGVKIKGKLAVDRGAWRADRNATTYVKVLGSPEAVAEFSAVVGKATRQTAVPFFRRAESGKTPGFVFEMNKKLSPDDALSVWNRAIELEVENNLGMSWLKDLGYSREGNSFIVFKEYDFTPSQWSKAQVSLRTYLRQALKELFKSEGEGKGARLDSHYAENDWAKGSEYWDSVIAKGRKGAKEKAQALADWYKREFLKALDEVKKE